MLVHCRWPQRQRGNCFDATVCDATRVTLFCPGIGSSLARFVSCVSLLPLKPFPFLLSLLLVCVRIPSIILCRALQHLLRVNGAKWLAREERFRLNSWFHFYFPARLFVFTFFFFVFLTAAYGTVYEDVPHRCFVYLMLATKSPLLLACTYAISQAAGPALSIFSACDDLFLVLLSSQVCYLMLKQSTSGRCLV